MSTALSLAACLALHLCLAALAGECSVSGPVPQNGATTDNVRYVIPGAYEPPSAAHMLLVILYGSVRTNLQFYGTPQIAILVGVCGSIE